MRAPPEDYAWLARKLLDWSNSLRRRATGMRFISTEDRGFLMGLSDELVVASDQAENLTNLVVPPSARVPAQRPQHVEDAGNVVKLDAWRRKA